MYAWYAFLQEYTAAATNVSHNSVSGEKKIIALSSKTPIRVSDGSTVGGKFNATLLSC